MKGSSKESFKLYLKKLSEGQLIDAQYELTNFLKSLEHKTDYKYSPSIVLKYAMSKQIVPNDGTMLYQLLIKKALVEKEMARRKLHVRGHYY